MKTIASFLAGVFVALGLHVAYADEPLPGARAGRASAAPMPPRRTPVVALTPEAIETALDDVVARLDAIANALETNPGTVPSAYIVRYQWRNNIQPNISQIVLAVQRSTLGSDHPSH